MVVAPASAARHVPLLFRPLPFFFFGSVCRNNVARPGAILAGNHFARWLFHRPATAAYRTSLLHRHKSSLIFSSFPATLPAPRTLPESQKQAEENKEAMRRVVEFHRRRYGTCPVSAFYKRGCQGKHFALDWMEKFFSAIQS